MCILIVTSIAYILYAKGITKWILLILCVTSIFCSSRGLIVLCNNLIRLQLNYVSVVFDNSTLTDSKN